MNAPDDKTWGYAAYAFKKKENNITIQGGEGGRNKNMKIYEEKRFEKKKGESVDPDGK